MQIGSINRGHPLARGLSSFYPFNAQGGQTSFDAIGNNNLVDVGSGISRRPGQFGLSSIRLSGTDYLLKTPVNPPSVTRFSFACWVNLEANGYSLIFCRGVGRSYDFFTDTTNNLNFAWSDGSNQVAATSLVLGRWYHIAYVVDGTAVEMFVNGKSDKVGTIEAFSMIGDRYVIGIWSDLAQLPLVGRVQLAGIWNRKLTHAEIRQLYTQPLVLFQRSYDTEITVASGGTPVPLAAVLSGSNTTTGAVKVTKPLASVVSGTTSFVGALKATKPLACITSGTTSLTGVLRVRKFLTAVIAPSTTVSGTVKVTKSLASSTSGSTTVTGALKVTKPLASVVSGNTSLTGVAKVTKRLASIISGTTTVSADLDLSTGMRGTLSGGTTVSGVLFVRKTISATISGSTAFTGSVKIGKTLSATFSGGTSASASLTVTVGALVATLSGAATVSGSLHIRRLFSVSVSGSTVFTPSLRNRSPAIAPDLTVVVEAQEMFLVEVEDNNFTVEVLK